MANFMGKDGFVWWQGVVEDRHDPDFLGRCRVRILGWHTEARSQMPTESLPWSYPIQPITSAAQTGVGISPTGPVEGTWVVGFFRDGEDAQEPVFFGTLGGIPQIPSPDPALSVGFSDPRLDEPSEDKHPRDESTPKKLLKWAAEDEAKVPRAPKIITHSSTVTELTADDIDTKRDISNKGKSGVLADGKLFQVLLEEHSLRSRYPDINYLGEPTTPRAARGMGNHISTTPLQKYGIVGQKKAWRNALGVGFSVAENNTDRWHEPDPESLYKAKYPYNHVHQSESGHLIEIDDTPGGERLHRYHRAGTFEEIGSLGQRITKVANEDYHIILNNDYHRVLGSRYESIQGKLDIFSARGYFHKTKGAMELVSEGTTTIKANDVSVHGGNIELDATGGTLSFKASKFERIIQSSKNTDTVLGDSTQKIVGTYELRSGIMQLASRGQLGISSGMGLNIAGTTGASLTAGLGLELNGIAPSLSSGKFVSIIGGAGTMVNAGSIEIGPTGLTLHGPMVGGVSVCSLSLGLTSATLKYGIGALAHSVEIGPTGITIDSKGTYEASAIGTAKMSGALGAEVSSTLNAELKGTVNATVEGSVMTTVKGGLVMLN